MATSKYKKYAPKDCKTVSTQIQTDDVPTGYISEEEYAKQKITKQGKHKGSYMYCKPGK